MPHLETDSSHAQQSALNAWRLFTIAAIVAAVCIMTAIVAILAGWHQASKHSAIAEEANVALTDVTQQADRLETASIRHREEMGTLRSAAESLQKSYSSTSSALMEAEATRDNVQRAIAKPWRLPLGEIQDLITTDRARVVVRISQDPEIATDSFLEAAALQSHAEGDATAEGWIIADENEESDTAILIFYVDLQAIDSNRCLAMIELNVLISVPSRDATKKVNVPAFCDFRVRLARSDQDTIQNAVRETISTLINDLSEVTAGSLDDDADPASTSEAGDDPNAS